MGELLQRRVPIVAATSRPPPGRRSPRRRLGQAFLSSALVLFAAAGLAVMSAASGRQPWWGAEAPAPDHLRLRKAGVPAALARLAAASEEELTAAAAVPRDWASKRLEAYKGGGAAPGPPPPYCTIMLNDDYKIIFLKCPRTATSAVLVEYFAECGQRPKDGLPESPFCLVYLDVANPSHVAHVAEKWGEYTVFGFTRNILARAVGQYVYLSSQLGPDCPTVSWAAFCRDPYVLGDLCAASAADGKPCCRVPAEHQYSLVARQTDCFATAEGLPAVDFLGRVENLDADFAALIRMLNARRGVPRLPPPARLRRVNFHNSPCTPAAAAAAAAAETKPQTAAAEQQEQQEQQQPAQAAAKQEEEQPAAEAKQEQPQEQPAAEAKPDEQEKAAKQEQAAAVANPEEQQQQQQQDAAKQQEPQQETKQEQPAAEGKQDQPQQEAKPDEQQQPQQEAKPEEQPQQEEAKKEEQQQQQEGKQEGGKQEGGGRRLASEPEPWRARPGTFLPCDPQAYFSGEHAHCAADLLSFYSRDAEFFQALAFREARNGLL